MKILIAEDDKTTSDFLRKGLIENSHTMDQVSKEDTQIRLPVSHSNDQVDRISVQLNLHLERLSALITSTRHTAKAIAHDLRTPLNRAFLVLQEAKELDSDNAQIQEFIQRAEDELTNVGQIFDTILRISNMESSINQTGFSHIPINELLEEMAETYQPVIEAAMQTLCFDNKVTQSPVILGDRKMLRQMLANLMENASFHCPQETIITLSSVSTAEGICIEVSDNGPGIPAEYRKQVLEPFYRLDASCNKPGNGLGLALVKAIAARHGAEIALLDN